MFSVHMCGIGSKFLLMTSLPGDKTSKSHQIHFLANFAHNVKFPGKLDQLSKDLFSQNDSVLYTHGWNRTEISIDCHIARE